MLLNNLPASVVNTNPTPPITQVIGHIPNRLALAGGLD